MKKPSFFRQSAILIRRYFHVFFNDKKGMILKIAIPLMTILIVCGVSCKDMFSVKTDKDNEINNSYPVLVWESVKQETKREDEDKSDDKDDDINDTNIIIEQSESEKSKWDGDYDDDVDCPVVHQSSGGEDYFLITNADQLEFLSYCVTLGMDDYLTYNYILQCDINLEDYDFRPIGSSSHPFTGTFNGNGHTIKNLKIDRKSENTALFSVVKENSKAKKTQKVNGEKLEFHHNGIVENLCVENAGVSSTKDNTAIVVGKLVGKARVTSVCTKTGSVVSDGKNTGSIVGLVSGNDTEIYTVYSTSRVDGKSYTGGLVGNLGTGRLSAAYFAGKISGSTAKSKHVGACVGSCKDTEETFKNVFYLDDDDNESAVAGVNNKDDIEGVKTVSAKQLKYSASQLVPFKDIMSAYEFSHLKNTEGKSKTDSDYQSDLNKADKYKDKDYSPEDDDDVDNEYGFKKDGELNVFGGTQTGLFMLVCVAIFTGICNSIGEICKERNILKREYMTNLRLSSYVTSKLVVQGVICMVQMLIVTVIFALWLSLSGRSIPEDGVLMHGIWVEVFITMFLLAFSADTIALLISSIVKTSEMANTFIPIILIVQIVFAGVLFNFSGVMEFVAKFMISKWGTDALAAITHLNDSMQIFLIKNPDFQLNLGSSMSPVKDNYASTVGNLFLTWGVLLAFIVVSSVLCGIMLRRVKNDKR